ncbi:MAG: M28 family peptidase [Bacteroidetes bacterium]|nr:M28 family peptidase [Bacteroidota bacterium]
MRDLTGDTMTVVGGIPTLIYSRYYYSPSNNVAAQYILEKFQGFGLSARLQIIDTLCQNVIAVKLGTKYPNQMYVIGAHFDNILWPVNPGPYDTVHGADDNCSGVCGVLEAAKILAGMNLEYTVVFAAWDAEESTPIWGAGQYVDSAYARHDSIKGYINMDMLAYNVGSYNKFWGGADTSSVFLQSIFSYMANRYIPYYSQVYYSAENYGSDQLTFMRRGYHVYNIAEYSVESNPNYHKITDTYANANIPYMMNLLKPTIGMLTAFALNKTAYFSHKSLISTLDTSSRTAVLVGKMPMKILSGVNSPRLYYKINSGAVYGYVNAYYSANDTFKFSIPGEPPGSLVKYYFAAQDTIENFVCTYPTGGSGINPPGTTAPQTFFSYQIFADYSQCSSTVPKTIVDQGITRDTINMNHPGYVAKMKLNITLNHQNDGDLIIQLQQPGSAAANMTQRNGEGGQNFINTTFDDDAALSISQGTPPFTGSFKPITSLTTFRGLPLTNQWVLRITDVMSGNTGTLMNWCLIAKVTASVNVNEEGVPEKYYLSQNYPNPFNSSTRINYSIPKNGDVNIKIYDILGREVRTLTDGYHEAGNYAIVFNAGEMASGIYFYRLSSGNYSEIKRMVIVK